MEITEPIYNIASCNQIVFSFYELQVSTRPILATRLALNYLYSANTRHPVYKKLSTQNLSSTGVSYINTKL